MRALIVDDEYLCKLRMRKQSRSTYHNGVRVASFGDKTDYTHKHNCLVHSHQLKSSMLHDVTHQAIEDAWKKSFADNLKK